MKFFLWMLLLGSAANSWAVLGVGDVVIVAADPAHELLWASEELPKWIEMIGKADEQVQRSQEMINIVGHPKDFAQQLVADAKPALTLTFDANSIQASADVLDFTQASWALYQTTPKNVKGVLDVPDSFQLFGETVQRDRTLYVGLASEKALRARVQEAVSKKHDVDTQELEYQEHALNELSATETQSEIELHQAGLAASQQRMEVAAARVRQAQAELQTFMGDAELEQRKQTTLDAEQSGRFVDAALERAKRATQVSVSAQQ